MIESKDTSEQGELSEGGKVIKLSRAIKLKKLADRREVGEIADEDFDIYNWLNVSDGRPLTRQDIGNQAVVLSPREFQYIEILPILLPNGQLLELELEVLPEDDVLILYPSDLG